MPFIGSLKFNTSKNFIFRSIIAELKFIIKVSFNFRRFGDNYMKIYWHGNSKNIIGNKVKALRKAKGLSQKALAEKLQLLGYDFTDLSILRIEKGDRFVADYEVVALAQVFDISTDELLLQRKR